MQQNDDHLLTYFRALNGALKIHILEQTLGCGTRTLRHWIQGTRTLNAENREKALRWARFFGYSEDRQYDSFL